jgi:hypothetical protein
MEYWCTDIPTSRCTKPTFIMEQVKQTQNYRTKRKIQSYVRLAWVTATVIKFPRQKMLQPVMTVRSLEPETPRGQQRT